MSWNIINLIIKMVTSKMGIVIISIISLIALYLILHMKCNYKISKLTLQIEKQQTKIITSQNKIREQQDYIDSLTGNLGSCKKQLENNKRYYENQLKYRNNIISKLIKIKQMYESEIKKGSEQQYEGKIIVGEPEEDEITKLLEWNIEDDKNNH